MTEITAAMVKDLRTKTGAGMMDCKEALRENNGALEASIDWLRTKGLAKAAKKSDRIAAEGLVAVAVADTKGAVIEVNSETDFVARNTQFTDMVGQIAQLALTVDGDYDALRQAIFPNTEKSVEAHIAEMVGTIGENMSLRRAVGLSVEQGVVAAYIHSQTVEGQGKIGVLVALDSTGDKAKLAVLGKQLAMHIAATNPLAINIEALDPKTIAREREILAAEAQDSGKPQEIIEKMVEGRLQKFYQDVVSLKQTFVIDNENTIEKTLKNAELELGAPIALTGFARFGLGEGIDKGETEDFAAEVAAATKQT